ncbi:glycosyl transferase family 1 [Pacificimonas flava]|uniref:Glycosyl transferase family 1 n=2 Tax=Pacificimonas TaxID=1960290 RepID=A0A219B7U9_9SPHN|nr:MULTISPECIES: glycosyltransferase family 4 protein [Pacificimonas]MBZ6378350.1 glycosyltransferase family 4 protein [Pacificimonas aurantium]OWV34341.1 glycosyl transferase family 1 [Pacificimonas flava]
MKENRALRIAQLAPMQFPVPPEGHGGTERVIHDLSEELVAAGHEVTLYAAEDSRTSARLVSASRSLRGLCGDEETPGLLTVLEAANLAAAARDAHEFDIIHCHTDAYHLAALGGGPAKLLTTIHWRADGGDRQSLFELFPDMQVAAISQNQSTHIPPANLKGIVPHGIPADRYFPGSGGGHLAFIGRMTDQKRPELAIDIAEAAGHEITLAGTIDPGNPSYFAERVEPRLGGGAHYVGAVNDAEKQQLLGSARALLFPIDWPEPFGLVMIEAMACGTPVIAFRSGSVPEIVEDGVTGFIVDTEAEAVAAVQRLGKLDRLRVRGSFEKRFSSSRMAEGYAALYRSLLD